LDLKRARTFVTVAELGSVSRASERLHVVQSALSRQIGAFEQELGLKLFDRVGRGLVLTAEGEQLLADCRNLLNDAKHVVERAKLLRRGDVGLLKVAAAPQFIVGALADFLPRYARSYPEVQVRLVEAIGWSDIRGRVERGDVHLGLGLARAIERGDTLFGVHMLQHVDLLAACHPRLPIGKASSIEIERLAAHPLLLLDESYEFRRTFDGACRLAGISPNVVFESRTPHTLLVMAEHGHGVAIIPSGMRTVAHRLRTLGVTYRREPLREPSAIFWDRRSVLPRYASAFCEQLSAYARKVPSIAKAKKASAAIARQRR
jgi:DNA-binding transcriptional LysR family regulator